MERIELFERLEPPSDVERREAVERFELLERSKAIERPPEPKKRKIGFLVKEAAARYAQSVDVSFRGFLEFPKPGSFTNRTEISGSRNRISGQDSETTLYVGMSVAKPISIEK